MPSHFTDRDGWEAIRSQPTWHFRARIQRGRRPFGAYFTTLPPDTPNLAARLRIPKSKLAYAFSFEGKYGLRALPGARGKYILYSPRDYAVTPARQLGAGPTGLR